MNDQRKTYAQLKRDLKVGAVVEQIKFVEFQGDKVITDGGKHTGVKRTIVKVQTNGVQFEGGSWLGLGMYGEKACNYDYINDTFTYTSLPTDNSDYTLVMAYKIHKN